MRSVCFTNMVATSNVILMQCLHIMRRGGWIQRYPLSGVKKNWWSIFQTLLNDRPGNCVVMKYFWEGSEIRICQFNYAWELGIMFCKEKLASPHGKGEFALLTNESLAKSNLVQTVDNTETRDHHTPVWWGWIRKPWSSAIVVGSVFNSKSCLHLNSVLNELLDCIGTVRAIPEQGHYKVKFLWHLYLSRWYK